MQTRDLDALDAERLRRLRAESTLARERLENEVRRVLWAMRVDGEAELDIDRGIVRVKGE